MRKKSAKETKSEHRFYLSRQDKRFYSLFLVFMALITAMYWYVGGKNPFIIPTLLCVVLVWRNHRKRNVNT